LWFVSAAVFGIAVAGCTPAEIQTAEQVLSAIEGAAQIPCTVVTFADGSSAGSVCGVDAGAVAGVAGAIQGILGALSPSVAPHAVESPPVVWVVGRTTVRLRAEAADKVREGARRRRAELKGASQ